MREVIEMGIPIHTASSIGSLTTLAGPVIEFVRAEVQRKKTEIEVGYQAIQSRRDPTYIGLGLKTTIRSDQGEKSEGLASDMELRFDIVSVPLDDTTPTVINHPTPALNVKSDLRSYNQDGEQDWLIGGAMQDTRLRSIEADVSWNPDGWNANVVLNDAVWNGNIDWSNGLPFSMNLSSQTAILDLGIGELIQSTFEARKDQLGLEDNSGTQFLRLLEIIDIATAPSIMDGTLPWSLNESNLNSLIGNPTSYLTPLLQDASGEWLLDRVLNSGHSLFYYLAQRIPSATLITAEHHRAGQIEIYLPLKTETEGARLFIHPEGYIEVVLESILSENLLLTSRWELTLLAWMPKLEPIT